MCGRDKERRWKGRRKYATTSFIVTVTPPKPPTRRISGHAVQCPGFAPQLTCYSKRCPSQPLQTISAFSLFMNIVYCISSQGHFCKPLNQPGKKAVLLRVHYTVCMWYTYYTCMVTCMCNTFWLCWISLCTVSPLLFYSFSLPFQAMRLHLGPPLLLA